ncbi:MAG: SBBP repeat-containing protein, partial [Bacteroidetes bacterium]|nr:SBBP repeat-containing protein [Bacteroidota bacterium]
MLRSILEKAVKAKVKKQMTRNINVISSTSINRVLLYILFAVIHVSLCVSICNAQSAKLEWVNTTGGTSDDYSRAITTDNFGGVYVTGDFGSTVDFDPGPGVFNLSALGVRDAFIQKTDTSGNFKWAKSFGGTYSDFGVAVATDLNGNVYITGTYETTVDFDSNGTVYNLTPIGYWDIFIHKLDSNGNFIWAKSVGGKGEDDSYAVDVDVNGDVCYTGRFEDTADFDPGPGLLEIASEGYYDIFIQKLDGNGNLLWTKTIGSTFHDESHAITSDASGNIYATGHYWEDADFDPGPGVFNLTNQSGPDVFVLKLDVNGDFVWAKNIGGQSTDRGVSIVMDADDNLLLSGDFYGKTDFDPGTGEYYITPVGNGDIFVEKLDSDGNFIWAKSIGGTSWEYAYGATSDQQNNVYTPGLFHDTPVDFDPGYDSLNLSSNGFKDFFVQKLVPCIPSTGVDVISSCTSLTWIDGNTYYQNNDSATFTLNNATGCDSVITLNFTFTGTTNTDIITSCGYYVWIDSVTYFNNNNSAIFILSDTAGCDSVVNLDLTINKSSSSLHEISSCTDYTWIDGNTYTSSEYSANHTLTNAVGCDSVVTLNLTIDSLPNVEIELGWAKSIVGNEYEWGESIAIDNVGNVLTTGLFKDTVDFDPGAGVFYLVENNTSNLRSDMFIKKSDQDGNLIWAKSVSSSDWIDVDHIAVDPIGNVLITGAFTDTLDADPGIGVFNLYSNGAQDIYVIKLDANGNFRWASSLGGVATDYGQAVAADDAGNVYVTAAIQNPGDTADFDPGAGVVYLTGSGAFVQKLDPDGNFLWANLIGEGVTNDVGTSIVFDDQGNPIIGGNYRGDVDFDPGAGTFILSSVDGYQDIFILKLSSDGNFLWAKSVGGPSNDGIPAIH